MPLTTIPSDLGQGGANLSDGSPKIAAILTEHRSAIVELQEAPSAPQNFFRASATIGAAELQALGAGVRTYNKALATIPADAHFVNALIRVSTILNDESDNLSASLSVGTTGDPVGVLRAVSVSSYSGVVAEHAVPSGTNTGKYGAMVVDDTIGGQNLIVQVTSSTVDLNNTALGDVSVDLLYTTA